jgi:primosomal protein N' (replication factor Y)
MSKFSKYASVILDVSLDKTLDYGVPADLLNDVKRGKRVEVTVKGHSRSGTIFEIKDTPSFPNVLPISRVLSETEIITEDLFELALWISKYYCAPLSQVLKVMLPSSVRKDIKPKQQLFVMRAKTRDELLEICKEVRSKSPGQASVLDVMLKVRKGILLTELLEQTQGTRSPVDSLVKKGCLNIDIVRVDRSPISNEEYFRSKPKILNKEQQQAFEKILKSVEKNQFETHLLHGITGSGKTEIYLQAIEKGLELGKGAIILVPEISLTSQTIERFRSRFEEKIAVLHHRLSHGERFDEWNNIRKGHAKIVVGARSAIFSPVQNLGIIIVDEEHEHSYKQSEEGPCYHARDVAVMRGKMAHAAVILGSATPCLESYYNAKSGKYNLSHLHVRPEAISKPKVEIVDMKKEFEKAKGYTNFSQALLDGIHKRHKSGEQTILFLNRRGYHTTFFCQECRESIRCNHCDMALTYHLNQHSLSCHLCGYTLAPPPKECPKCKNPEPMKYRGVGTELLEKSLHAVLPDIRTLRIDADTTRHKGSHQKLLRDFGTGKADVLIGTQMIAKGLHFPEVTLVGVINCDTTLNIPDFRSSETAFQLITQVAGRAGRGALAGEVILQTCIPENSTIKHAANQDYLGFYEEEIETREMFKYPPFSNIVKITFSGKNEKQTLKSGESFRQQLLKELNKDYELNPVLPSGYAKIKDNYRFQLLIRGPQIYSINKAIQIVQQSLNISGGIRILIDINPTSTYF